MCSASAHSVNTTLTMDKLKQLGRELLTSRAHVNNAPILLSVLAASIEDREKSDQGIEALLSMQAFFTPLLRTDLSTSAVKEASERLKRKRLDGIGEEEGNAEAIYRTWLRAKYGEFLALVRKIVVSSKPSSTLRVAALDALMEFVRQGKQGKFQTNIYFRLLASLVRSKAFGDVILGVLISKYFKYKDICYFSYSSLEKLVSSFHTANYKEDDIILSDHEDGHISGVSLHSVVRNVYDILSHIPPPSEDTLDQFEDEMWSTPDALSTNKESSKLLGKVQGGTQQTGKLSKKDHAKKLRSKMSKAWMAFLRLPLPVDVYKKILVTFHKTVVPYLTNPILLSDFLTKSYDIGGVISVMALNGLFILITQHGLEYPDFYNKLYALLGPSIFMAKYRSHFFELLDTCLKSPLLPAYLAAAFAKKMSRLALSAPPSGALIVIAMIHNLLRRHPSINCLVHRQEHEETDGAATIKITELDERIDKSDANLGNSAVRPGADPFLSEEIDTAMCKALQSSLWEVETLRRHYCPAVSRFVASLENDLTIRAKTTEVDIKDFSSGSYGTVFSEEVGRRIKQVPLAFYKATPTTLFPEQTTQSDNSGIDFAGWTFTPYSQAQKQIDDHADKNSEKRQFLEGSEDCLKVEPPCNKQADERCSREQLKSSSKKQKH